MTKHATNHSPLRSCIACGTKNSPDSFLRVRTCGGALELGGKNGRSAYVCKSAACIEKAIAKRAFARSFRNNVFVSDELKHALRSAVSPR
ncbi:MAG TPA: YlxR family protein [Abditibacteriaceae bacterium]|jgi:hypothetical protein